MPEQTLDEIRAQARSLREADEAARTGGSFARPQGQSPGLKDVTTGLGAVQEEQIQNDRQQAKVAHMGDTLRVGTGGIIEGIPVIGKPLRRGLEMAAAGTVAAFGNETYDSALSKIDKMNADEKARNPGLDTASQLTGTLGGALALPNPASLGGAIAGGVGLSEADLVADKAVDEGRLPTGMEAGTTMAASAAGTAVGWYMGKTLGGLWDKYIGESQKLPDVAKARIAELDAITSKNGKIMDGAGIKLNPRSMNRLISHIDREAKAAGLDPRLTPNAWSNFAVLREKALTGDIDLTKFTDTRKMIRDSMPTSASDLDWKVNKLIVGKMKRYIDSLPGSIPGRAVVGSNSNDTVQATKDAVTAWQEMNKAHAIQMRTELVSQVFKKADLKATQGKASFDKALQDEFGKLYTSPKFDEFEPNQQLMIEKMAKGGSGTALMNRMDRSFHGGLFTPIYKAMTILPRRTESAMAEQEAMRTLAGIGQMPMPVNVPASTGAMMGSQLGGQAGAAMGTPNPVQLPMQPAPSPARGSAGLPALTPTGQPQLPTFPEIPGLGGKVKLP